MGNYIPDKGTEMGESVGRQACDEAPASDEAGRLLAAWPKMLEAGFRVLCQSGIVDDCSEGDKRLVIEIWDAMEHVRRHGLSSQM